MIQWSSLYCRLVVLINTTPNHGESNHITSSSYSPSPPLPVFTDKVTFVPINKVAITRATAHLTSFIDVKSFALHIRDILAHKQHLVATTTALNLTQADFPNFLMLSDNVDQLLESISDTLLSALDSLDHDPACHMPPRKKRDLIREHGLFPGVGRVLAYLTGTLTSDATAFINANTANLQKLKSSQMATITVVNHTMHVVKSNTISIQRLHNRLNSLSQKLQGDYSRLQATQIVQSQFFGFSLMLENLLTKVTKLTETWKAASENKVHHYLLHGSFYEHITNSLDATTLKYKNLKPILRQAGKAHITACHTYVWTHFQFPLLPKDTLPLFKLYLVPVPHGKNFDVLSTSASAISFSDDYVYEFSVTELANAVHMPTLVIVKSPVSKVPLKDSCIYSIMHNVTQTCTVRHLKVFEPFLTFEHNFLVYSFPPGQQHFALLRCHHTKPKPQILTGSSAIYVPPRCRVRVGNVIYESDSYKSNVTVELKQSFAPLHMVLPSSASNIQVSHDNQTDWDISDDLASLHVASDILGTFSVPNEHVFAASVTVILVTFALFIAVLILFLIVCGPLRRCFKDPPVQIIQMQPVKAEDM